MFGTFTTTSRRLDYRRVITATRASGASGRSLSASHQEVSTPEEFATRIKFETEKWAKVIRAANIKAE